MGGKRKPIFLAPRGPALEGTGKGNEGSPATMCPVSFFLEETVCPGVIFECGGQGGPGRFGS